MGKTPLALVASLILFTVTALTDFWDGYLARRLNKSSTFGAFIDPLADKIFVLTMFAVFAYEGVITSGQLCIFLVRDLFLTVLRSLVIARGLTWTTSSLAKSKTFLQFVVLYGGYLILAIKRGWISFSPTFFHNAYNIIVWGIAAITVYSAFDYVLRERLKIESIITSCRSFNLFDSIFLFLATGGFFWVSIIAPGTVASIFSMIIAYVFCGYFETYSVAVGLALFGLFLLGWVAATRASFLLQQEDPSIIVVDEFVAMLLVYFLLPVSEAAWYFFAFLVFRFFDILKPFPISFVEQRVKGGLGIMLDDLIAALCTVLVVRFAQLCFLLF